ncbi:MAG TPA: IPExxxVDY family protein [Bacteroidales bacterium]
MAKKLSVKVDYFEDYQLLGLVSNLKDYRLTYFINTLLELDLKKFDDLKPDPENNIAYSWYCHWRKGEPVSYYLIGNHHANGKLIPAQKNLDYFFIIKNSSELKTNEIVGKLRVIDNITAVFQLDMEKIKDMNMILETIEMHELDQVIRPKKPNQL